MQNRISKVKKDLAEKLDIPADVILNIPKITIVGNDEITIENHQGILQFSDNFIRIKSSLGNIGIEGSNFEILFISGTTIVLSGVFKSMEYEGK
ncbi:sporulation protein YqfC [Clostridium pasteurianum DSM 525 = ATCC 6013]|uniref:Sporulation protein YqfC n=1 Tax=Clostridium pasteurianum DSM 525 = ATCC 6013 TaxID=1262449 RepID=A0A0H3J8S1_CLOPA|nr:sporulation protein YqfC [Clostridium pasteurianum]AJA48373.1 sporulation protein YqfC [Clostridium pasteurianum DSM 525 = ATCC 6013]AJA52361.1 sporulation protein YqfC [Clostridium pasteurianum DSM 525 = ATCC 6013]AOZ75619.1 sporulation protein [Clostridium pasteurianum DSM 525 = ATCC 6013]AOZ79415.1 sporulation protein [Clostridium pasteurianum]ELP60477.1 sporulation protein YqfC [Clostridium pasteurianum DSM 525 = ATCC 6013]